MSTQNKHSCAVVWTFLGIALLWDWNENRPLSKESVSLYPLVEQNFHTLNFPCLVDCKMITLHEWLSIIYAIISILSNF